MTPALSVSHGRHGEAASNVDRCPEGLNAPKYSTNRRLVRKLDAADEPDLLVVAVAKALRLAFMEPRHVTASASLDQGRNNGGPKRTGAAGHQNIPVTILHCLLPD